MQPREHVDYVLCILNNNNIEPVGLIALIISSFADKVE